MSVIKTDRRLSHDELLTLGGEYAELYQRQLLEEEIEATD